MLQENFLMRNFLRHKRLDIFLSLNLLILLLILTALLLVGHTPAFYRDFSRVSQRELEFRTGRLLQDLLEAASLVNQGQEFQLEIREDDLNTFLAAGALPAYPAREDSLSHSVENLQVHFLPPRHTGDLYRPKDKGEGFGEVALAGKTRFFHLDTVISVHCRLNKRGQGFRLRVEKLRAGVLPIPQRFCKNIISEIEGASLEKAFKEVEIINITIEKDRLSIVGRGRVDSE